MKYILLIILFGWLVGSGFAAESAAPTDFSRMRGLTPPSVPTEIVACELDADIYETTRNDLGDIRIFRAGNAVPHIIEQVVETSMRAVREPQLARRVSLREAPDNHIEVVFELQGDNPRADGLEIMTPLHNYDRNARVWAGQNGVTWKVIISEAQVCDYTRFMDFAQREVVFPSSVEQRYIKLEISSATVAQTGAVMELTREFRDGRTTDEIHKTTVEQQTFRMDDVCFWRFRQIDDHRRNAQREYPMTRFSVSRDAEHKTTIVDVTARREPLTALALATASANFSRQAEVLIKVRGADGDETSREVWKTIGSGILQDISFRAIQRSMLTLNFAESRETAYRVVIRDGDNPPLKVTGVKGCGNIYRAVFLSERAQSYMLFYGAPNIRAADYDVAAVLGHVRRDYQPVMWLLEAPRPNPGYAPTEERGAFFSRKSILITCIALVVMALGWALIRAVRHTETATAERTDGEQ